MNTPMIWLHTTFGTADVKKLTANPKKAEEPN
jgi:hypothetical protein